MTMSGDLVEEMFPGDGSEYPDDDERQRADGLVGYEIPRRHEGRMCYFADSRTNRAFVRAQVRRWAARTGRIWK